MPLVRTGESQSLRLVGASSEARAARGRPVTSGEDTEGAAVRGYRKARRPFTCLVANAPASPFPADGGTE